MKNRTILFILALLLIAVCASYAFSEMTWLLTENSQDPLRQLMGLPSIAVGNLSPAARNPGLELLCTGLYDTPGGYCYYFTDGVPFISFRTGGNVTLGGGVK
jgi:hypothetical protein